MSKQGSGTEYSGQLAAPISVGEPSARKKHLPVLAIIGLICAVILPPIGFLLCIIALFLKRNRSRTGLLFAGAGILISFLLCVVLIYAFWAIAVVGKAIFFGVSHSNQAQYDFQPIASQIESLGGKKLCDNGDAGYGPDNLRPWYQVYYRISDSASLTNSVEAIAAKQGYHLQADTQLISQLQGAGSAVPYGNEHFNPKSDYLIGKNGQNTLSVTINRQASVALYCGVEQYGKQVPTGVSDAILNFDLSLPEHQAGE